MNTSTTLNEQEHSQEPIVGYSVAIIFACLINSVILQGPLSDSWKMLMEYVLSWFDANIVILTLMAVLVLGCIIAGLLIPTMAALYFHRYLFEKPNKLRATLSFTTLVFVQSGAILTGGSGWLLSLPLFLLGLYGYVSRYLSNYYAQETGVPTSKE